MCIFSVGNTTTLISSDPTQWIETKEVLTFEFGDEKNVEQKLRLCQLEYPKKNEREREKEKILRRRRNEQRVNKTK